ncbi:hypothetical protein Tco_0462166 [Tanacetum coccineum]
MGAEHGKRGGLKALVTIVWEGRMDIHLEEDEDYLYGLATNSESDTESELEKQPLYDRFVTTGGMHAVPPPMTGNYMPSGPDIEVDYSQFTYGPKQTQPINLESQSSEFDTCESNISTEPSELVSEPVVNESNVECQPKVWSDAPIIEEYESDSEDEDCDFHEKRMARKAELNSGWYKKSSQRELRQTWNNVQRVNKQNQFVPSAVLHLELGKIPVNTNLEDYPHRALKNKGIVDSGCSRHMTGNKAYLAEFQDFKFPHDGLSLTDPTNPEQETTEIPPLEDIYQNSTDGIFTNSSYDDEGAVADFTNLETVVNVSPIPTSRIISSHPSHLF